MLFNLKCVQIKDIIFDYSEIRTRLISLIMEETMKKSTVQLFLILITISICFYAFSEQQPINPEGRTYLFKISPTKQPDNASLAIIEKGYKSLITFNIPKDADIKTILYALFLKGEDKDKKLEIFLNNEKINFAPVRRSDGLLYRIPAGKLNIAKNLFEIKSLDNQPLKFESIEVFSLVDSFEEVHFGWAFSDIVPFVQPPKHPDQDKYDALHYELNIDLNMSSTYVNATFTVTGIATVDNFNQLVLDFDANGGSMIVSKIDTGEGTPSLSFSIDDTNDWLIITLPTILDQTDTFTTRISYSGIPSTGGAFASAYNYTTHGSGVPLIYTFNEPYKARKWLPCKDVPEDKATIDLHITAPSSYFAVSNGKLTSIEDIGGGKRRFNYSESYPIATYLISICCTNYTFASAVYTSQDGGTTMTVGHYIYPENTSELGATVGTLEGLNLFSKLFGEYPFITEKYVTATHEDTAGMEHQTCTSMPPLDLAPDGRGRRNIHELSHQWFGDSITMRHFDHLWLNEGFGTYCEAIYNEYYIGTTAYHNTVNGWEATGINNTTPLVNSNADAFAGSLVYRKGGWVLHMLRHVIGDDNFFLSMKNYAIKYAYSTALTPNFQAEVEAVYGQSLDWFFQEWVYGVGRPTYSWSWTQQTTPEGKTLNLTITQSGNLFTMPLDVRVSDLNGNSKDFVVWNNQNIQSYLLDIGNLDAFNVIIDPDNWVLNYKGTAPQTPTLQSVVGAQNENNITIKWQSDGVNIAGFQLVSSEDLTTWTLLADIGTLNGTARNYIINNIGSETAYYFCIRAISTTGQPSELSDTYGARRSIYSKKILVVDGYDRWDSQGRGTSHKWAAWHGKAVSRFGLPFDTCANEIVSVGTINLADFEAVLWVLGEESTTNETFSSIEQGLVKTYLNAGGNLFVSGAEVGWDLDSQGTTNDRSFYNNYLKATFVSDDSNDYSVEGTLDGIFKGLIFNYDNGSAGIYPVNYADVIAPYGGSVACLKYDVNNVAGIQFKGNFPEFSAEGALVHFAFPFETIYPEETRNEIMKRILLFFNVPQWNALLAGATEFILY